LGKLRVGAHHCLSFLQERKTQMLPQLALYSDKLSCTYELNPPTETLPQSVEIFYTIPSPSLKL